VSALGLVSTLDAFQVGELEDGTRPGNGGAKKSPGDNASLGGLDASHVVMDEPRADADELELLVAARRGDHQAFAALVRANAPRLARLARSVAGSDDADDVVQETIVAAWRSLSSFRGDARFSTWLQTIAYRQALRHAQRAAHRRSLHDLLALTERQWADDTWTVDPADVVARASGRAQLVDAIGLLPPHYRAALVLHDIDGLPAREVAAITDVPVGTAKARIRRARMALVSALAEQETGGRREEAM